MNLSERYNTTFDKMKESMLDYMKADQVHNIRY